MGMKINGIYTSPGSFSAGGGGPLFLSYLSFWWQDNTARLSVRCFTPVPLRTDASAGGSAVCGVLDDTANRAGTSARIV